MRHLVLTVVLLVGWSSASSAPTMGLTPQAVSAVASRDGGPAAISRFFRCDASGEEAYGHVAAGSTAWVAIAVELLPAADGCVTESLHDALARALVRAPEHVLPLVDSAPSLPAASVCIPFLPAEEPSGKSLSELRHEEAVLRAVHRASLQAPKRACLRMIEQTRDAIRRSAVH